MNHALNKISSRITQPKSQGASQAMLYGTGMTPEDMNKAQVGICSVWYEGNTCNMHLNDLSAKVKEGVQGAGLVGMTVAGFLQRAGFAVTVYEQAPAFSRIGAGIILSANVMKVLRRLDLEQMVIDKGIKPPCGTRPITSRPSLSTL